MARTPVVLHRNMPFPTTLEERIFYLFPGKPHEFIAKIVGAARQTVQGWRRGGSKPTLEQVAAIANAAEVDTNWMLTGQTTSLEAVTFAYFPKHISEKEAVRPEIYEEARHMAGYALNWDYQSEEGPIHAVAVLWRAAIDKSVVDPMPRLELDEQPDELGYVEICERIRVAEADFRKAEVIIDEMRRAFQPPIPSSPREVAATAGSPRGDKRLVVDELIELARKALHDAREQAAKANARVDTMERILARLALFRDDES